MKSSNRKLVAAAVTFSSTIAASGPALGQAVALEEVIVTAQKREERLMDVPISIAVVSEETIKQTGVKQLNESLQFIPNVTMSSTSNFSSAIRIRGVGSSSRNIGFDTRVGVYVDGVYMGQSQAQNLDLIDIERVEVLRGPQGTQFGRNTVAGVINTVTNKPSEEFELDLLGEVGNYNFHRIGGTINVPLSDRFAARLSAVDIERDGFVDNLTDGSETGELNSTTFRGHLSYTGDAVSMLLSGDYLESDRNPYNGGAITDWTGTFPNTAAPDPFDIAQSFTDTEEREVKGVSLAVDVPIGEYSLKSISAFRDNSARFAFDVDRSELDMISVDYPDDLEQLTQEFQFFSPVGGRFSYVAGLYLYKEEAETARRGFFREDIGEFFSVAVPPLAPVAPLFVGTFVGSDAEVDTESWAVYVNGTYELTERWTFGFGARYSEEERDLDFDLIGSIVDLGPAQVPVASLFGVAVGPVVGDITLLNFQDDNSYEDFSPTLSLTYALNDDANIFIKYAESFKSGGFNVDFVNAELLDEGIEFDPETVESWEVGLKGAVDSKALRYSVVAFYTEFEDYQINQFVQLSNNTSVITIQNAAEVTSQGVEVELEWYPTNNLLVTGALGYNKAEFDSFPRAGSVRNPNGLGSDLESNALPLAPEWTSAVALQYNHPLDSMGGELVARLDWLYSSGYYSTEDNVSSTFPGSGIPWGETDSIDRLNARLGLQMQSWSIYFWGKNILDEEYQVGHGADFLGTAIEAIGEPRTYGAEFRWQM